MTVDWAWVGRATPSSAWVRGEVSGSSVRLAVDTDPGLSSPVFYGPVEPDPVTGVASIVADGLDPATRYHWALEVDTVLDTDWAGSFRTHPPAGEPATVRLWAGSCAGSGSSDWLTNRVSNHPAFDAVRAGGFDFGIHMGDLHYRDIGSGTHVSPPFDAAKYRQAYRDVLTFNGTAGAAARQGLLYRSAPLVAFWDDHDYGPNDADGSLPHKAEAALAYRQCVPHYTLPDPDGAIYQSFPVARVLFACLDVRYHKSGSTMLGSAQKAWLADLLESSDAGFLVLTMGSQWSRATGTHADSFAAYPNERAELVEMFHDLGWAGRMCVLQGDNHAIGIDNGGNIPGGFPLFQFAPFDSNPATGSTAARFNVARSGSSNGGGRGQWGSLEIVDTAGEVEVTGTGYLLDEELFSYTFTVDPAPPAPPEPPPAPVDPGGRAPVAVPEIRTDITWLSCDLASGRIIGEIPQLTADRLKRVVGAYTSSRLTVPIPTVGPRGALPSERAALAARLTRPAETMIVAVVNAVPTWAGVPLKPRAGTRGLLEFGAATLEAYLDHRFVRDHEWVDVDEASVIAAGLFGDANAPVLGLGNGIGLEIDAPPTGRARTRRYEDASNATVYERLRELMAVIEGPEWTIDVDWADERQTTVAKIARVRKRLGVAAGGSAPGAVFQTTPAAVFRARGATAASYVHSIDRSDGRYANVVVAYSSGEGEDQPTSTPAVDVAALLAGRPIWEKRYEPSSSITSIDVLDDHAQAELERVRLGAETWRITARWDAWPRYGVDWRLGDDIGYQLRGHRHPAGVAGVGRAIGFEINPRGGTIVPILLGSEDDD